jgi:hypothetical protein
VKRDFSDMLEKLKWIKSHQDEVRRIAANGKKLARELLTPGNKFLLFPSFLSLELVIHPHSVSVSVSVSVFRECLLLHF